MKEILIGLGVLSGIVVTIYAVVCILGVIGIFLTNLFSSSYMPYKWYNIRHEGFKGIAIIVIIMAILAIAYLFGSAVTL